MKHIRYALVASAHAAGMDAFRHLGTYLVASLVWFAMGLFVAAHGAAQTAVKELDDMAEAQNYDAALAALVQSTLGPAEQLAWLEAMAERGHVPMMYVLSRRLLSIDLAGSLKWYSRGRLVRTLDVAECRDRASTLSTRVALDRMSKEVVEAGQANENVFSIAIFDTLKWDEQRAKEPPSKWICGQSNPPSNEGDVLEQEVRSKSRSAARLTLTSMAKLQLARYVAVETGRKANYQVTDSGFVFEGTRSSREGVSAHWLDDRRVVFAGTDGMHDSDKSTARARGTRPNGVFVWDTQENKVVALVVAQEVDALCAFRGFISFRVRQKDGGVEMVEGTIEKLKKAPIDEGRPTKRERWPLCKGRQPVPAHIKDFTNFRPLLPQHGYLDLTKSDGGYRLHPPGNRTGVLVNFPDLAPTEVVYDERKDAYIVSGRYQGPGKTVDTSSSQFPPLADRFFYLLHPGGKVEKISEPFGFCSYGGRGGYFTPRGILRGRCLSSENREELLSPDLSGASSNVALSPGGCRLALRSGPVKSSESRTSPMLMRERDQRTTLKMIEICERRP